MARPLPPPPLLMARPLVEELFFAASQRKGENGISSAEYII